MKTLLYKLCIENWPRKLLSLILAMLIWIMVNHSMTVTKIVHNIPVRVTNLPQEKTIEGMQMDGILNRRITLTLTGNKTAMEDLTGKDLEILVDAEGQSDQWIAKIAKNNLISLKPDLDVSKMISSVSPAKFIVRQSRLVTEKIPVLITQPIGETPKGYQFLDVWPYQLFVTVTGPEETVKKLKAKGLKLTFNLNDISKEELDALFATKKETSEEVEYLVPAAWKKVNLPLLSDTSIAINDPLAKDLRLSFSRQELLPLSGLLPISLYFSPKHAGTMNPETYSLATNDFVTRKNGIKMIGTPLFAQGVSRLFLDLVKERMQMLIIAAPKSERGALQWSIQFISPHELEDLYVAKILADSGAPDEPGQDAILRNRFRGFMNSFRLYTPRNEKLSLKIEMQANTITVNPLN